jgi:hypothetical protein
MTKTLITAIETYGRTMYELAKKIAATQESENVDALEDALETEIRKCLAVGQDAAFVHALELAQISGDDEVYYTLQFATEYYSTVSIRTFANQEKPTNSYMFAIPVTILSPNGMANGKFDNQTPAFKAFVKSIRSHGLVDAVPSVLISDYLYHAQEMEEFIPSMLFGMPDLLFSQAMGREHIPDDLLGRGGWPATNFANCDTEGRTHLELRFLVGVVIGAKEDPFYRDSDSADDEDDFKADDIASTPQLSEDEVLAWQEEASELLTAALGEDDVDAKFLVGRCDLLHEALRDGVTEFKLFSLRLQLNEVINGEKIMPKALCAILVPYGVDGTDGSACQLRISIVSVLDDRLRCGYALELSELESFDEVTTEVVQMLHEAGVTNLQGFAHIQQLDETEGDSPIFITLADLENSDVGLPPVSSTFH